MDLAGLLNEVIELEREVTEMDAGDPGLAGVGSRINEIERELEQERGMETPLVPDASSPPNIREVTIDNLERALRSLRSAVASKR